MKKKEIILEEGSRERRIAKEINKYQCPKCGYFLQRGELVLGGTINGGAQVAECPRCKKTSSMKRWKIGMGSQDE